MSSESLDRRIVAALERATLDEDISKRLTGDDWAASETGLVDRIADAVDVPATLVATRLRELRDDGVIRGYRPRIDYDTLGYSHVATLRLVVAPGTTDTVCERLRAESGMVDVYQVTEPHDVVAVGRFRSTDAMNQVIRRLLVDRDVTTVKVNVVINALRDHRLPGDSEAEQRSPGDSEPE